MVRLLADIAQVETVIRNYYDSLTRIAKKTEILARVDREVEALILDIDKYDREGPAFLRATRYDVDRVQSSPDISSEPITQNWDKWEKTLIKLQNDLRLQEHRQMRLNSEILALQGDNEKIEEAIYCLESTKKTIIERRYKDKQTVEEIAIFLEYTPRHVSRLCNDALETIRGELNGSNICA